MAAVPEHAPSRDAIMDVEDEWEYEYSTTENEIYYLTLDLSIPGFTQQDVPKDPAPQPHHPYRQVWYNPLFKNPEPTLHRAGANLVADNQPADPDEDDEQPDGAATIPDSAIDPALMDADANAAAEDNPHDDDDDDALPLDAKPPPKESCQIQILELHSPHPLIAYREMTFRGTWASVIGTELLFGPPSASTPALRTLTPNTALLAAGRARIACKQVLVAPRTDADPYEIDLTGAAAIEQELQGEEFDARYAANGGVYIHVGNDTSRTRRPQARFLEDLLVLKRKRGEEDEPTTMGVDTKQDALLEEDEIENRRRRKHEMDKARRIRIEEEYRAAGGQKPPTGRPWKRGLRGKPTGRVRGAESGRGRGGGEAIDTGAAGSSAGAGVGEGQAADKEDEEMSVPTPSRWQDGQAGPAK